MKACSSPWLSLVVVFNLAGAGMAAAQDTGWMQPRVRVWYLGAVDGGGIISSNAEEAYLFESINGTTARVVHHTGMTNWTSEPTAPATSSHSTQDMGPVWIHPARLQTVQPGERWMGWEILTIARNQAVPKDYQLLPLDALLAINPQRQIVRMTYRIGAGLFNTGTAYFDADTGLLLYHNAVWTAVKMFFVLAEINYDFAHHAAFPEDNGPHTGFKSFLSEQGAGGSVIIHSMVESRYGATIQTFVMPSAYPSGLSTAYQSLCFFGDVPVVRRIDWLQSANSPPDQWPAFGQHLYWWIPRTVTGPSINVFDVPMSRTSDQPLTYTATQTPSRFHFSSLKFDNDGYVTEFSAKDPPAGLDLKPPFIQEIVTVDGRSYFQQHMALPPLPVPGVSSIFPAAGPTSGGTTITITGTHFVAGATTVTIGGAAATSVTVQGATSLTCVTPPGTLGTRDVTVRTMGGSVTVPASFQYAQSAAVTPPASPSQPVTVSVPITGGTVSATFNGVTSPGTLMITPVAGQTPPLAGATFLSDRVLFVSASGVTYANATVCFPYSEAAVTAAGLTEETLMVWMQPPGSTSWSDVTSSHDVAGNRICALNPFSLVALAGVGGSALGEARYLAEGATGNLFATKIALVNPSPSNGANVLLRFLRADATTRVRYVSVPPRGRRTVDAGSVPEMATAEFSTVIESDAPLVVDRTMSWSAATLYGAHAETAVAAPALTWYLAEGATHSGFNLFYLLQNPNATSAQVRVRYLRPSGVPLERTYTLAPASRTNVWVDVEEFPGLGTALVNTDVSAVFEVLNGQPIIVERAMYADVPGQTFGAGHESAGITAPATEWFLAEGATGPYFDLFVLIANPGASDAGVEATYLLPNGTTLVKPYTVAANSRFNIWVDYEDAALADTAVSTTVRSTSGVPIIVERAMWWPGTGWYEAHNTAGATATGTRWALAEGEVDAARNLETYILIANTSATPADVKVTVLFEDAGSVERTFPGIPGRSRFNVPVGGLFAQAAGKRFGAIVESLGATPAQIVVERAMYWDAAGQQWAAGTNALATKLQ